MFSITDELKKLPHKPGVYIMKDENGAIIYVGKAVDLHNRVRNYFQPSNHDPKVRSMVRHIATFEYVVTDSEVEALVLECNLIKLNSPKYNIRLKDDKAYPYIKVTVNERLPRVLFSRERQKDKARYFGPYVSAERVREIIELIHRIWPLRRCSRVFPRDYMKERPCLNHHIGRCGAPCNRLVSETEYRRYIQEAERFIQGKTEDITDKLTAEMAECAEQTRFERAAELRDLIEALRTLSEKQKADTCDGDDRDVIGMAREKDEALAQVFFVRGGKMTGREHFMMQGVEGMPDDAIYGAFIKQFYGEAAFIPRELVLQCELPEKQAITEWLSRLKGRQVQITVPQKGEKRDLTQLANNNAAITMEQFGAHMRREAERNKNALAEIAKALGIDAVLERIEAYDISNIQGFESVGSMVVFEGGKAKNSDYRKFKIKGVLGPDDYASMEEVITRRFTRYQNETRGGGHQAEKERNKFSKLPDLLMADGGKGQVRAVQKALAALGMDIPVCGMVKDERHRTRGLWYDEREVSLPRHGEGFRLVTRIQDETHRFAVEYHRKLRASAQVNSVLNEIPGIGPTRRKALMRHFKGIEPLREADVDTLAGVASMNRKAAEAVYEYFHKNAAAAL